MSTPGPRSTLEGVPKQFINSLRVLFDILDEGQTGFVRLVDIETRWKDDDVNGLPKGVVEALRKVTPGSGKLTFERFVAGLKIALLRTKGPEKGVGKEEFESAQIVGHRPDVLSHGPSHQVHANDAFGHNSQGPLLSGQANHLGSRGALRNGVSQTHQEASSHFQTRSQPYGPTTAAVRPNNALALGQQRTKSMPHLGQNGSPPQQHHQPFTQHDQTTMSGQPPSDPVSQSAQPLGLRSEPTSTGRLGWSQTPSQGQNAPIQPDQVGRNKDEIVNALKRWQLDRMLTEDAGDVTSFSRPFKTVGGPETGPVDKRPLSIASTSAFEHFGRDPLLRPTDDPGDPLSAAANRRTARRKEPRRHTLANGIDYNMIKRMKQLEQEKDVLLQGLEAVERARDWYHAQIRAVQDKQKYIGKTVNNNDYTVEAHQERMNFQQTRIFEVNQQLKALVDSSEKGFPLHMNLAVTQPIQRTENAKTSNIVAMLKAQNRLLTQEVSQKSEKISQLEREKATLIRDMFETRSKNRHNSYDDTTFM